MPGDPWGFAERTWGRIAVGRSAWTTGSSPVVTRRGDVTVKRRHQTTRSFPGRLTLEEWLASALVKRIDLVRRAQCDLLGSFRFCTDKACRRARTCCGDDPEACRQRLWLRKKGKSRAMRQEWTRLERLKSL
jgi:hypothetical protein